MDNFIEIKPERLDENPFKLIGQDWMLVTAKKEQKVNTMTASWGGLGVLWSKKVAYVTIRPQRYTKEFIDASERFTLSFFDENFKQQLGYLGKVSGRDEDKISKVDLSVKEFDGIPYFEEGRIILVCKKLYAQDMKPGCFIEKDLDNTFYPQKDYHTLYIAEIEKVFIKE